MRGIVIRIVAVSLLMPASFAGATFAAHAAWQLIDDGDPISHRFFAIAYDSARERIIRTNRKRQRGPADTWELIGDNWVRIRLDDPAPDMSLPGCFAFDRSRNVSVYFGGKDPDGLHNATWEYDGAGWRPIATTHAPAPRSDCGLVYDEARQQLILFGGADTGGFAGFSDTWVYDGIDWTEKHPSTHPGARTQMGMVYDINRDEVVIVGGFHLNLVYADTWTYDPGRNLWTQKTIDRSPGIRVDPGLAYDPIRDRTVVFGGSSNTEGSQDTWEWDGRDWHLRKTTVKPPARHKAGMVFDASRSTVVMHGGAVFEDSYNDTWSFDGSDWSQIVTSRVPSGRTWPALVYDPRTDRVVAYGGLSNGSRRRDTWELVEGKLWQQVAGANAPSVYRGFDLVFDQNRGTIFGFGGQVPNRLSIRENHEYDSSTKTWTSTPVCCAAPRLNHSTVYAQKLGGAIMFGGTAEDSFGSYRSSDETWRFDSSTEIWSEVIPGTRPGKRRYAAMAYNSSDGNTYLQGGESNPDFDDFWKFDGIDWTLLSSPSPPGERHSHRMEYDISRDTLVLIGGGPYNEGLTWEYARDRWTAVPTPHMPDSDWCFLGTTYDPVRKVIFAFGGGACSSANGTSETWAYGSDPDHDGIVGRLDNCPNHPNSDQANADGDEAGDVCDSNPEL